MAHGEANEDYNSKDHQGIDGWTSSVVDGLPAGNPCAGTIAGASPPNHNNQKDQRHTHKPPRNDRDAINALLSGSNANHYDSSAPLVSDTDPIHDGLYSPSVHMDAANPVDDLVAAKSA